jgi:hypothetical protein
MSTPFQQIQTLSWISNHLFKTPGPQPALQQEMNTWLASALVTVGDWELVWGPVVWKKDAQNPITTADNVWYVAKKNLTIDNIPRDTYVVAISATAERSLTDDNEDIDVQSVVNFTKWYGTWAQGAADPSSQVDPQPDDANNTYISFGTATGVYELLTQAPSAPSPSSLTLPKYLQQTLGPDDLVVFAGHSLGGALSPTIALGLLCANMLPNIPPGQVCTYPSAGATPGNGNFVALFKDKLPATSNQGFENWNSNIVNTYDTVPCAWALSDPNKQDLDAIPTLYGNNPPLPVIQTLVNSFLKPRSQNSGITYTPLPRIAFTSSPTPAVPQNATQFKTTAFNQHGQAYLNAWKINPP